MVESRWRSLWKTVSYRIICVISLLLISWALTGSLIQSTYITVVFQTFQTIVYYLHERAWARWSLTER